MKIGYKKRKNTFFIIGRFFIKEDWKKMQYQNENYDIDNAHDT